VKTYPITDVRGDKYLNPAPPETRAVSKIASITSFFCQVLSSAFCGGRTYKASQDCPYRYESYCRQHDVHQAAALTPLALVRNPDMCTYLSQGSLSSGHQSRLGHASEQQLQQPYPHSHHANALNEPYLSLGYVQSYSHHSNSGSERSVQSLFRSIYMVLVSSFSSRYSYNNTGVL